MRIRHWWIYKLAHIPVHNIMANTRRYGIQIGLLDNSATINESAGIHIQKQQSGHDNYGILFEGDSGEGNKYNAISWGSIDSPSDIAHLYIKSGTLYININDVETPVGSGSGVSSLDSLTGDLSIEAVRGMQVNDNNPNIELSTSSFTIFSQIATVTVANSNTETTLIGTGLGYNGGGSGDLAFPENFIAQGDVYRITAKGIFGTKAAAGGALTIKIKLGSTLIISTGAQTPIGGITNQMWKLDADITCYTDGDSGTVMGNGNFAFADGTNVYMNVFEMVNTGTVALDTTASQTLDVRALWATADTANTISLQTLTVEKLAVV